VRILAKEPFFEMDNETEFALKKLYVTCNEIELGNVGFKYYDLEEYGDVNFKIIERKKFWEAAVYFRKDGKRYLDIYRIDDKGLYYVKSETKQLKKRE